MSIRVIKKGLLDTIQDLGRYGYQHLGINPTGAMDHVSMRIANALVGNRFDEAVLEMHFPGPILLFERDTCFALSGADAGAWINDEMAIPVHRTICVKAGSRLSFSKKSDKARIYLAVRKGFDIKPWLNSNSSHIRLGLVGSILSTSSQIHFKEPSNFLFDKNHILPWQAISPIDFKDPFIHYVEGNEFSLLEQRMKDQLHNNIYTISSNSDRMGYRISGQPIALQKKLELISTAVTKGTIQLLPDGHLIILMADHQTTGGYPRLGHIIAADIPKLAQLQTRDTFQLKQISLDKAHEYLLTQELHLKQIENACTFQLEAYLRNL
jgi:antagonist of KipI